MQNLRLQSELEETIRDLNSEGFEGDLKVSVHDIADGSWASVDGDKKGWAASIIKVPVMTAVFEEIQKRNLTIRTTIPVNSNFMLENYDYISTLPEGTEVQVANLVFYMMTQSDNEATNMLVDKIGVRTLNSHMRRLDTKRTMLGHLLCPNVPRYTSRFNRDGSNITTPDDMVNIMRHIYDEQFSKLHPNVRRMSDYVFSFTNPSFLRIGFPDSKIKSKIGLISSYKDGNDNHEVGIVDDRLVICLMANKIKNGPRPLSTYSWGLDNYSFEDEDYFDGYFEDNLFEAEKPTVDQAFSRITRIIGRQYQPTRLAVPEKTSTQKIIERPQKLPGGDVRHI